MVLKEKRTYEVKSRITDDFLELFVDKDIYDIEDGNTRIGFFVSGICLHKKHRLVGIDVFNTSHQYLDVEVEMEKYGVSSQGMLEKHQNNPLSSDSRFIYHFHLNGPIGPSDVICLCGRFEGGETLPLFNLSPRADYSFEGVSHISHVTYRGQNSYFAITEKWDSIISKFHDKGMFYEQPVLDYLESIIPEGAIIFDVGANVGNHTIYFEKFLRPQEIFVFEANEYVADILTLNCVLNATKTVNYTHLRKCVSSEKSNYEVAEQKEGNLGGTTYHPSVDGNVKPIRLDEVGVDTVDFVKIDVEGMEFDVLKSCEGILNKNSPLFCIEVTKDTKKQCLDFMSEWGYEVQRVFYGYKDIWTVVFSKDHFGAFA